MWPWGAGSTIPSEPVGAPPSAEARGPCLQLTPVVPQHLPDGSLGLFSPVCTIGIERCLLSGYAIGLETTFWSCSSVLIQQPVFKSILSLSDSLNLHVKDDFEKNLYFKSQS